tara:strand:+ start:364 stop:657 length:294 start_codon:yes stop_codon:yes gene_type:complete
MINEYKKLITIQDQHNHDKAHVFKFTKDGQIFYNQANTWNHVEFYTEDVKIENNEIFGYEKYLKKAKKYKYAPILCRHFHIMHDGEVNRFYTSPYND